MVLGIPFTGGRRNTVPGKAGFDSKDDGPCEGSMEKGKIGCHGVMWEYNNNEIPTEIDKRDADTPDKWVPRHPDLIRLTGRHPFNVEPPLAPLYDNGFLCPIPLHYVRNHGAAPRLTWEDHEVRIDGLVNKPTTFKMDDIIKFPRRTFPCTLVCAGNRRKEENLYKQSIGFSWGGAAQACSVWTGVRLSDLLKACGVKEDSAKGRHVCFHGPEDELPHGSYGTSVPLKKAMDPANDIVLAYEQNGKVLEPDHGYPIRIIIPGYIGGRMVKWLTHITVTEEESNNYYHFHDNRVLPSHVDAEKANKEGWWFKPEYIINDLNINSVICYPRHNDTLKIEGEGQTYTLKGYAYSGGGRKVIRAEVSFDDGAQWHLAKLDHPEKPTEYGKYWCWCFWEVEVPVGLMQKADYISLRAWDEGMNTQPKDLTWNVMGMMNNSHFRVKVNPRPGNTLHFEHPTIAGPAEGGWMKKREEKKMEEVVSNGRMISMAEVKKHDTEKSAWFIHKDKVYDATPFLEDHPGGAESILINAGIDATEEFDAIHSEKAHGMLKDYYIGELDTGKASTAGPAGSTASDSLISLNPKERIPFKLVEKESLSHDTRRFRFALQSPQHILGLPIGKHMFLSATIDGKLCMRAYTPISSNDDVGYFDLVIKVYFPNVHPKFPDGGKMSQHLESLKIGDTIDVKGPLGHFVYEGKGNYMENGKKKHAKKFGMIAGGTGLTPCYQVIKAVLKDPEDTTECHLLYANQTEDDILLRQDLEAWAAKDSRLKVWYTVDRPTAGWKYSSGFINEDMLRKHMPAAEDGANTVLMCGPPPMIKFACIPNLEKLGFKEDRYLSF